MKRTRIKALNATQLDKEVTVSGWARTVRKQKTLAFIELNDGSTLANLQIITDTPPEDLTTGCSLSVKGTLVKSPGGKQLFEIQAKEITLFGRCPAEDFPLQKKHHSFEFLRTIAHLRARTNTGGAVLRVRNALAYATHQFFQTNGFLYVQTPIITASDAEGGGEQFTVTTLDLDNPPRTPAGPVDFSKDFFGKRAYLTVSGQLNGEALATAMGDIYTFGPTFRAENSHTSRHLAEFWMIEPEMAFAELEENMECAEAYLKYIFSYLLQNCPEEVAFFDHFIEKGLLQKIQQLVDEPFARLSYTEAIEILKKAPKSFEFPVKWGCDLQSEHERYLAEEYCKKGVILTNYPKEIKAFYMKNNPDGKTVAAMDILLPKIGEVIGGSQREDDLTLLSQKIQAHQLNQEDYWWYLELRKYGSVPHAGFGAGFERVLLFATGMENIRDLVPFPRYPGHADF